MGETLKSLKTEKNLRTKHRISFIVQKQENKSSSAAVCVWVQPMDENITRDKQFLQPSPAPGNERKQEQKIEPPSYIPASSLTLSLRGSGGKREIILPASKLLGA